MRYVSIFITAICALTPALFLPYPAHAENDHATKSLIAIIESLKNGMESGNTDSIEKYYPDKLTVLNKGKRIEPLKKDIIEAIKQQKKFSRYEVHTLSKPMATVFPDGKTAWVSTHQKRKVFETKTDKLLEISEISTLYVFNRERDTWIISAIAETDDGQVVKE